MKSFEIEDIADFVKKLFSESFFSKLHVYHMEVRGACSIDIDGRANKEFFDEEVEDYVSWESVKMLFYQAIRGDRLPIRFSISFVESREGIRNFIEKSGVNTDPEIVSSLNINVMYDQKKLYITSGNSYKIFTMDKSLDGLWDAFVQNSFKKLEIS